MRVAGREAASRQATGAGREATRAGVGRGREAPVAPKRLHAARVGAGSTARARRPFPNPNQGLLSVFVDEEAILKKNGGLLS